MRHLVLWLSRTWVWKELLLKIIPFIRFTTYYTRLRGKAYHEAYDKLSPGNFCLSVDEKKLTTFLVPGIMTHASFCVNKRGPLYCSEYEIVEATHEGVIRSDFFDICKEASRVLIMELDSKASAQWWCSRWKELAISRALALVGKPYDTSFEFGVEALYCSELVYQCDKFAGPLLNIDTSDFSGLGQEYVSPDGLLFAPGVRCKWDTDGLFTGLSGPEIEQLCKKLGFIR